MNAAGMTASPDDYRWSSYGWHGWGRPNPLITDHALYEALSVDAAARRHAYRELFKYHLADRDVHRIRTALTYNHPLGNDRFRAAIEAALGRSVGEASRGRPAQRDKLPIL